MLRIKIFNWIQVQVTNTEDDDTKSHICSHLVMGLLIPKVFSTQLTDMSSSSSSMQTEDTETMIV